jgi:hypothetical protein
MCKRVLQKVGNVLSQEHAVGHVRLCHDCGIPERSLDLTRFNEIDELLQQKSLQFESCESSR